MKKILPYLIVLIVFFIGFFYFYNKGSVTKSEFEKYPTILDLSKYNKDYVFNYDEENDRIIYKSNKGYKESFGEDMNLETLKLVELDKGFILMSNDKYYISFSASKMYEVDIDIPSLYKDKNTLELVKNNNFIKHNDEYYYRLSNNILYIYQNYNDTYMTPIKMYDVRIQINNNYKGAKIDKINNDIITINQDGESKDVKVSIDDELNLIIE